MLHSIQKFFLFAIVSLYFFSCANISSPTGGPKDTTPPELVKEKSLPLPNTLNYSGKVVDLTFNEDVTAQSIQEQLLITPLEENPYKVIHRRNKVRLEFEKDFSPNTTYTFNFREGIKDITEGNPAQNLVIPFSTGSYIDSIFVTGNVTHLLSNKPAENILVSLYKAEDTLSPFNSKPLYFSKTSGGGNFEMLNIKSGNYHLYAIDDKNKNLKYEETEPVAYLKNVRLDSSLSKLSLQLALFDTKAPVIKSVKSSAGVNELQFNEGLEKTSIQGKNKNDLIYSVSRNGSSVFIYNIFNTTDSIPVSIQVSDSTGNTLSKDLKLFFDQDKKNFDPGLVIQSLPADKKLKPGEISIGLLFNKPLTKYVLSQLRLKEDTTTQALKPEEGRWLTKTHLEISKSTRARDSVILIIPSATFNFLDTTNKSDTIKFTFHPEENLGSLSGKVITDKSNYILELLDNNYKVVKRKINPASFSFEHIEPGAYFLRAIEDENKNERWDSGNIQESKQPEKVYLFKDVIELRANWEIQDINFTF